MAGPDYQQAFLYTLPSGASDADKLAQTKRDYGVPIAKPDLPTEDKKRLFGNLASVQFEAQQIVGLSLAPYGFKMRAASLQVNRAMRDVFDRALTEIARFSKEQNYEIRDLGTYCFRYINNTSTIAAIRDNPAYVNNAKPWYEAKYPGRAGNWNNSYFIWAAVYDRDVMGQLNWPYLSNHAWGSAIDINPSENPLHGTTFDMPKAIVAIMRKYGLCWGGYYGGTSVDSMHFEYKLPTIDVRRVYFPFSSSENAEVAPKYYHLNESGQEGYYPVGLNQTLHGGAHIHPEKPTELTPVVAALPGYVVAARFMAPDTAGDNALLREFTDQRPLSFVVLRHELIPREEGKEKPDKAFALYSAYMHLELPNWKTEGAAAADRVAWLRKLLDLRFGSVVNLAPDSLSFLKTYWASEPIVSGAESYKVRDAGSLPAKKGDRLLALAKPPPEDVTEAIEAFQKGAVVTFSKPLLQVAAGEVIGYVTAGRNRKAYLHWEFFAPSGSAGGIAKLVEQWADTKSLFKRVKETCEDNFLELPDEEGNGKNEVKPILVDTLPTGDQEAVADIVESEHYAAALEHLFNEAHSFAKEGKDEAKTQEPFTYPVTISLKNTYDYKGPKGSGLSSFDVSFTKKGVAVGKSGIVKISDFNKLEFVVQVPAQADAMLLSSNDFILDEIALDGDEKAKSRLKLLETLVPFRWRHLLLEHVNEWTPSGLDALIDELDKSGKLVPYLAKVDQEQDRLLAAKRLDSKQSPPLAALKTLLRPLTWWARPVSDTDAFGEAAILGPKSSEESLFGSQAYQLPKDAKIDNLHPASAAWLCDVLWDVKKLSFRDSWPTVSLCRDESSDKPPFCSWIAKTTPVEIGDKLTAVLIQHGYGSVDTATFKVKTPSSTTPVTLLSCVEATSVFSLPTHYSFWGACELQAFDGVGNELKPAETPCVKLETHKPKLADGPMTVKGAKITSGKTTIPGYAARLALVDHCPESLAGYIYFRVWKVGKGAQPDFTTDAQIGEAAEPVIANKIDATVKIKDVTIDDGFITKATTAKTRVTAAFTFDEYCTAKVFKGALASFRVSYELCKRVQSLQSGTGRSVTIVSLEADGLTITTTVSSGKKADYELFAKALGKLPKLPGFSESQDDSKMTITIAYTPPKEEPGELSFDFTGKAALAKILEKSSVAPGESLYAKPSFIAPNGGHYVLAKGDSRCTEPGLSFDLKALKQACNDCLEVHGELAIGPLCKLAMGEIQTRMSDQGLVTDIDLYGDIEQWKKALPQIKLDFGGNAVTGGTINGTVLTQSWILFKDDKPISRWGKDLSYSVGITHADRLDTTPATPTATFKASPELQELKTDESAAGRLRLVGKGHCIPTGRDLLITCEKEGDDGQWLNDEITAKKIKYKRPGLAGRGRCDEYGNFVADVDIACFNDGKKRRFTWLRILDEGRIAGIDIGRKDVTFPQ